MPGHLHFVDEIVVLLDRCTDGSKAIARNLLINYRRAWEFEGGATLGLMLAGPWIIDADADEWISDSLAAEIRATIENTPYDIFDIPVRNYIGGHYVAHGWGGGSFGKVSYLGLYKTFAKRYGMGVITLTWKSVASRQTSNSHSIIMSIKVCLTRFGALTAMDYRAKDLVDQGEMATSARMCASFVAVLQSVRPAQGL